ncbi:MAG: response regulator [Richelia sp. RM2_1_2]|nr:response regulator [Richelia sp. RM1_1_1]NJO26761.1 response regulator [Richelia sp. SL_2_1]NJO57434.1 response regulator [Richelia sp. RM2_1_2]
MRILIVEDDECIAKALENILSNQHYMVDIADSGLLGWEFVETFTYDLILLDVILPEIDGIKFCQKLRQHNYQMPVLLLTAQNSSNDKVLGLDAGADDYVVKPFEITELLARIRVLLRRKNTPIQTVLQWENLCLNPGSTEVTYNGHLLNLTPKEYRLLELFLRNRNIVFNRSDILDHLWSMDEAPKEETVTAHIKGLRQKMTRAGAPNDLIETVYGLGYRLKDAANDKVKFSREKHQNKPNKLSNKQQQTKEALTKLWEKLKVQSIEGVEILEQAVSALLENNLEEELRENAQRVAHKLAGRLGIFSFSQGSDLAREIEQIFKLQVNLDRNQGLYLRELVKLLQQEIKQPAFKESKKTVQCEKSSVMVIIDDDEKLVHSMIKLAVASGIQIELVRDLLAAKEALTKPKIDVVLLSIALAKTREDSLNQLAKLTNCSTPPIPVILSTTDDSLANRVKLSRLFTHIFLEKTLLPEHLLKLISQVLTQSRSQDGKVMVVDDDPQILSLIRELLEPCGLKLSTLNEPLCFWDILMKNSPDLLILDVEMPDINGIDLCQVVRNEPRWSGLPIVFLTVHNDADTIQKAFNAGANECLSKSIVGPELVTHIFNRLERIKLFQTINGVAN